jgi:hypothetical protein
MDLPGRKIIVSRSFHDLPASRGTREANAILRNGKDQFVAETAAGPPRGKHDPYDGNAADRYTRDSFSRIRSGRRVHEVTQNEYIKTILGLANLYETRGPLRLASSSSARLTRFLSFWEPRPLGGRSLVGWRSLAPS